MKSLCLSEKWRAHAFFFLLHPVFSKKMRGMVCIKTLNKNQPQEFPAVSLLRGCALKLCWISFSLETNKKKHHQAEKMVILVLLLWGVESRPLCKSPVLKDPAMGMKTSLFLLRLGLIKLFQASVKVNISTRALLTVCFWSDREEEREGEIWAICC